MSKFHLNCTAKEGQKKQPKQQLPPPPREEDTSLLAVINPDTPCCCEVISRALKDDVPKHIGLSGRRATLQLSPDTALYCNPDDDLESDSNDSNETAAPLKPKK